MKTKSLVAAALSAAIVMAGCGGDDSTDGAVPNDDASSLAVRIDALDVAVSDWEDAASVADAKRAAERSLNLIVGPDGPGYGDLDGDGAIEGEAALGLLPGLDGELDGLATLAAGNDCIERDVLGGSWGEPGARWQEMLDAIDAWEPGNNTMPSLQSHPMRVVGWATFTLASDDLDLAHEFAGHARLHVDVTQRALDC